MEPPFMLLTKVVVSDQFAVVNRYAAGEERSAVG